MVQSALLVDRLSRLMEPTVRLVVRPSPLMAQTVRLVVRPSPLMAQSALLVARLSPLTAQTGPWDGAWHDGAILWTKKNPPRRVF
jgi:hypothetical protein